MGMFDWYRPAGEVRCPVDGHPLEVWQGKDGPRLLLVWQEGIGHPVEHRVDEEVRFTAAELADGWADTLPRVFVIYSYDCPRHQPIEARCTTRDGIWAATEVEWPRTNGNIPLDRGKREE